MLKKLSYITAILFIAAALAACSQSNSGSADNYNSGTKNSGVDTDIDHTPYIESIDHSQYIDGTVISLDYRADENGDENSYLTIKTDDSRVLEFKYWNVQSREAPPGWGNVITYIYPDSYLRIYYKGVIEGEDASGAYLQTLCYVDKPLEGDRNEYTKAKDIEARVADRIEAFNKTENPKIKSYDEALRAIIDEFGYTDYEKIVCDSGAIYYTNGEYNLICGHFVSEREGRYSFFVYKTIADRFYTKATVVARYYIDVKTGEAGEHTL